MKLFLPLRQTVIGHMAVNHFKAYNAGKNAFNMINVDLGIKLWHMILLTVWIAEKKKISLTWKNNPLAPYFNIYESFSYYNMYRQHYLDHFRCSSK